MDNDELTLFDADTFGKATKRRRRSTVVPMVPVPYRIGWYRVRQSKGPIPYWHLIAPPAPDDKLKDGSHATLCGKVGLPISHLPCDGPNMVICPDCERQPRATIYHPPNIADSRTRHPSNRVRNTDPTTSRDAAESVGLTAELQLSAIDRSIREAGPTGLTDEELCRVLLGTGWADSGIRTRRRVLADMAVIFWNGTTRPSRRGREMRVWVSAEHKEAAMPGTYEPDPDDLPDDFGDEPDDDDETD